MDRSLTIGQLAQATGVTAKTIRYYEQVGVLPAPRRSPAGYRQYAQRDVHRLLFLRRARALGLSLQQLKTLTAELDNGPCEEMRPQLLDLVQTQLHTVKQQVAEFQLLQQQLEQLLHRLLTMPPTDHTEGCRCLDLDTTPTSNEASQQPLTSQLGEDTMPTSYPLESLTILTSNSCEDGSCGCGCGCGATFVHLSLPSERAGHEQAGDTACHDTPREDVR